TRSGEVVQIGPRDIVVAPFGRNDDAGVGEPAFNRGALAVAPTPAWRGRVVDALGKPIDGGGPLPQARNGNPDASLVPPAMARQRLSEPFRTGVRTVDIFTPLCYGQR